MIYFCSLQVLFFVWAGAMWFVAQAENERPNVVVIMSDDQGR